MERKRDPNKVKKIEKSLHEVAWTGMVTAFYCDYCHRTGDCLSEDPAREALVQKLRCQLKKEHINPYRLLNPEDIPRQQLMNVAVRKKECDRILKQQIEKTGAECLVNIGCGFDTCFYRLEEWKGLYLDIDLPEVIYWKRRYLKETENYRMIGTRRVFEEDFFRRLRKICPQRTIFLIEGVFCYFPYGEVVRLAKRLFSSFPNGVLICDTFLFQKNFQYTDSASRFKLKYPGLAHLYEKAPRLIDRYMRIRFGEESDEPELTGEEKERCLEGVLLTDISATEEKERDSYWIGVYSFRAEENGSRLAQLKEERRVYERLGQFAQVKALNREIEDLEIQGKKTEVSYYPANLQIEHTDKCNAACIMCSHYFTRNHGTAFSGKRLTERLEPVLPGVARITLQGMGEPFLHPNIISIIKKYQSYGIRMTCSTNASVMSRELAGLIHQAFYDINISCDACTAETYEKIRRGLKFSRFLENVRLLRSIGKELRMQMAVVIMRQNIHELPGIVTLAAELGFQAVTVMDVTTQTLLENDQDSLRNYPAVAAHYIREAERIAGELGIDCALPNYLTKLAKPGSFQEEWELMQKIEDKEAAFADDLYKRYEKSGFYHPLIWGDLENFAVPGRYHCTGICKMAAEHPFIDIQGNVFLCCTSWMHSVGNIYEDGGFWGVWNGPVMQRIRELFYAGNLPKYCEGCVFLRDEMVTGIRVTDVDEDFYRHNYDEQMSEMLEKVEGICAEEGF